MNREVRSLISWEDFVRKEFETPAWLINPYVPADGFVFLWGETSTGKSPLGWHLAAAVGRGDNFFGLPALAGRVLYLEVDTPQRLVHERLKLLAPAPNVDFLFLPPLSVPEVAAADLALLVLFCFCLLPNAYCIMLSDTLERLQQLEPLEPNTE